MTQAWDVKFERLGRHGAVAFTVRPSRAGGDALAKAIAREAVKKLATRYPDFEMEQAEDGTWTGYIASGFSVFPFTARRAL